MPTLVWTLKIDGADPAPIRSLQVALDALKASAAASGGTFGTLSAAVHTTGAELERTGAAARTHGPALVSFFQNALAAATGFLAANVFQSIVSGLTSIGGSVITTAGDMERMRAGFTTMLGSAQQADILIKQLQAEANRSPFELKNFQDGARMLLGIGTAASEIVPRLHEVSNVVAALGGGTAQFDRIMTQLGQIETKGKAQGQDLKTLAEDGVPVWGILADAMGVTKARAQELATQGVITSEMWDQAFSKFANSTQITAAAEAQSHTFQGLVSTIHDIGAALSTAFGEPMLRAIEPTLERIVTGLQDPAVLTTLAQWGAAAGQFVNGLIQVGTVVFQVGTEIIGALKPVFDMIGQFFGLSGGPNVQIPTPPDFSQLAGDTTKIKDSLQATADPTKAIKEQIKEAETAQRAETRAAQETELSYSRQSDAIANKIKALQAAYDLQNQTTSRADLEAKIRKDEALAVDVVSAQGQAAAKRLVTEREQLAQMDRKAAFDTAKAGLEQQKSVIDDKLKATREANAQAARDTQAHIDDLRSRLANQPLPTISGGGGGGLGGGTGARGRTAADAQADYLKSLSQDQLDAWRLAQAAGDWLANVSVTWIGKIKAAVDDLITKLHALGGAPGAVLGAVLDDWNLLTGTWDWVQAHVVPILRSVDTLITTLGGRDGLQGVFIAVGFEFQRLMLSIAAVTPIILRTAGAMFGEFGSEINIAIAKANEMATLVKFGLGTATGADVLAAHKATQDAEYNFAVEHERNRRAGLAGAGDFSARIAQINADINRQQEAAFKAADARFAAAGGGGPAEPTRSFGATGPAGGTPVAPPYQGPGYHSTTSMSPQAAGPVDSHVHVTVTTDQNGLLSAVAHVVTGKFVAKQLGSYASSSP